MVATGSTVGLAEAEIREAVRFPSAFPLLGSVNGPGGISQCRGFPSAFPLLGCPNRKKKKE